MRKAAADHSVATTENWRIALTLIVCAIFIICRKPDRLTTPQFFVEDGMFFTDAYERGWTALFLPYAGYLHGVPRAIAWATSYLEPTWLPAIYNLSALLLTLGVSAAIFSPRLKLPAKPALAFAIALAPHAGEVHFHFTNIQWVLALGLILVLLAEDGLTRTQRVWDCAMTAIIGLTGPFVCLFLPLFALRWWQRRTSASKVVAFTATAASALQILTFAFHRDPTLGSVPEPYWLLCVLNGRFFGTFLAGYQIKQIHPSWLWLLAGLVSCGGIAWISWRRPDYRRIHLTFLATALLTCAAAGFKFLHEVSSLSIVTDGDRYFFIPHVLLAWNLIIWVATARSTWQRAVAGTCLAAALLASLSTYRGEAYQRLDWAEHVAPIRAGEAYTITINPGWMVISSAGRNSRR